ncbi:hypothetical protein [Actinomadura violacea]|uniref:hypothetical protein n=1 Tax=Actinomadura violacea TaxID=2819934 RepID=UPI001E4E996E|nr:hypothetical protein [Actinomadura violacea]
MDPQVLARARARVLGVPSVAAADPVPAGTAAATDGDRVWLLPVWPDGATPALLDEYQTAPMPLDRAGQARRVLAAALRCCWTRLDDAPWPGTRATVAAVLDVYAGMSRGDADLARRWATGELRRLADTGWLLLDEKAGGVRLGPRVSLWAEHTLSSLRALLHRLPEPPPSAPESHTQDPLDASPAVPSPRPAEPAVPAQPGPARAGSSTDDVDESARSEPVLSRPAGGEAAAEVSSEAGDDESERPAADADRAGAGASGVGEERAASAPPVVFRSPSVIEPAAAPPPVAERSSSVDNSPRDGGAAGE